jgi:hypothetical protein
LVAILETSDLFLRATNTDGDATSLREALALDVPVAASDASPRPEGVVLFRKRDTRDMRRAVAECLARGSHPHRLETASGGADHFLDFFNAAAG